jgi:hypothetical protein
MKETRFQSVSPIQQAVTSELYAMQEEAFSGASKRAGAILNEGRKQIFHQFVLYLWNHFDN